MVDSSSMADIRGISVEKVVKGFADEEILLKRFVTISPTNAREVRWFQKTAGFLDSPDTSGITASQLSTDFKALPIINEATFTRNTSYIRKFFFATQTITMEDINDTDVDILAVNLRDLARGVERQVEYHIYNVITESDTPSNIQTIAITNEWDDASSATIVDDILKAKEYIRNYNYDPEGAIFLMRPDVHRFMLSWLIATKGSSIPQFASQQIEKGVVMEILGVKVIVSTICTSDKAVIFVNKRACTYKQFHDITTYVVDEPGIGKTIRALEEGVALLTDPKAVVFFSNIGPS